MANRYTPSNEQRRQQVQELTKQLEEGTRAVFESARYEEYLRVMGKFSRYSVRNTILIAMQRPDASLVAGYSAWQTNFGRQVNKGEHAIKILAPMTYTATRERDMINPDTQQPMIDDSGRVMKEQVEVTIPSFRVTNVFDVKQTSGRPLPTIVDDLEGSVQGYRDFVEALRRVSPVPIQFEDMEGKDGYYHQVEQRIAINDDLSERQTMAAMIHEIAHAKLHALDPDNLKESAKARGKDQRTMEVEAESISFVVNSHFGIDTSANSLGYVASWSKNKELPELHASLQVIKDTAAEMIESIEMELMEIRHVYVDKSEAQAQDRKYQPLRKVEELKERNYNMIDEILNNGFGDEEKREVLRQLAEQYQQATNASLSFFAAACEEYHDMGPCYETVSFSEAVERYKEILDDPRMKHMGNGMGIVLHDPTLPDYSESELTLIKGQTILGSNLDMVETFLLHPLVQEALVELRETFPEFRYEPPMSVLKAVYPENMTAQEIATSLINLAEDFDLYDFRDRVDNPEQLQEEVTTAISSGRGMEYAPFLNDVIEEAPMLRYQAEILLERIRAFVPEPEKAVETEKSTEPVEVTLAAEQETQPRESTTENVKEPESEPEKTKAARTKGKETDTEKKPKKKGSIHKRLKENKEKLEKQQGKEKPQKGVELA